MAEKEVSMEQVKIMPYSQSAEQAVIGTMIISQDAVITAAQHIGARDFYLSAHGEIFEAALSLFNSARPIDIITISDCLTQRGTLDKVGGLEYLAELAKSTVVAANVAYYAQIVKEKAILRRLISASEEISAVSYRGDDEVENILDFAEQKIFEIVEKRETTGFVPISELLSSSLENLVELTGSSESSRGILTGFTHLDKMLNGIKCGNLVLIAARPAMGKTSFALNIAHSVAKKQHKKVAIFSLEMTSEELSNRMWSSETAVDLAKIQSGDLNEREWIQLFDGMELLSPAPIYVDDSGSGTVTDMRAKCRRLKREHGLDLVIIDHLQLMRGGKRIENRQQEVAEISRNLKTLAKDMEVPIIVLSQLNRAPEARGSKGEGKRPALSDLRDSGAIEQDADIVLMLYRDDYYNEECERPGVAECIIAKHRNGPTGRVELLWRSRFTQFVNMDKTYDDSEN